MTIKTTTKSTTAKRQQKQQQQQQQQHTPANNSGLNGERKSKTFSVTVTVKLSNTNSANRNGFSSTKLQQADLFRYQPRVFVYKQIYLRSMYCAGFDDHEGGKKNETPRS
ncbi:hypothetical protein PoB_005562300 [Plakobranchus ocellatus]|uniref:Uncharacterized protein n=1 Tax=Plakobranchus ocellatus TaxID=259542 RepID=A0AAV4CCE8_9GAST|nr:hypothetical protein PoB_005562300 [Plakobranchus ocellatus]